MKYHYSLLVLFVFFVSAPVLFSQVSPPPVPAQTAYCGYTRLTRATPPAYTYYYWQGANANGTSQSNSSVTYDVTTAGNYYIRAYNYDYEVWSNSTLVTVSSVQTLPPAPTNVSGGSRCGSGVVNLGATPGTSDAMVAWFQGSTLKTYSEGGYSPNITSTTTFTAKTYKNGCNSATGVNAQGVVNTVPSAPDITQVDGYTCATDPVAFGITNFNSSMTAKWLLNNTLTGYGENIEIDLVSGNNTIKAAYSNGTCWSAYDQVSYEQVQVAAPGVPNESRVGGGYVEFTPAAVANTIIKWYLSDNTLIAQTEGDQNYTRYVGSTTTYNVKRFDSGQRCSNAGTATATITPVSIAYTPGPYSNYLSYNTLSSGGEQGIEFALPAEEGTVNLSINCNSGWVFGSIPPWASVNVSGGSDGTTSMQIQTTHNFNSGQQRTGYLSVSAADKTEKIYLNQKTHTLSVFVPTSEYLKKNTLDLGGENYVDQYLLTNAAGDLKIFVGSDTTWTASVEAGSNWLTLNTITTGTEGEAVFTYKVNSSAEREGKVAFKHNGSTIMEVYVKQNDVDAYTITTPYNWVHTTTYNGSGGITGQMIGYYDKLGRAAQSIVRNIEQDKVVATATGYDAAGRPAISTLPAAVNQKSMNFIENFLPFNTLQSGGELVPNSICSQYYNNNNTAEPFVPHSERPYSSVTYSKTIPGAVRQSFMPGEAYYNSHPAMSFVVNAAPQELTNHPLHGNMNLLALKALTDKPETAGQYDGMYKSVSIDAEGKESITYFDAGGRAVASCMSAPTGSESISTLHVIKVNDGMKYIDIHLPKRVENYTITKSGAWKNKIINLATDAVVDTNSYSSLNLSSGIYRIYYTGTGTANVTVQYTAGYKYYSFNACDEAGRPVRSLSPKSVEELKTGFSQAALEQQVSKSTYNTAGWLLNSYSVDEGLTTYKYRKDGAIRFSQNAKQAAEGKFSYTNYDPQGRVVEAGVYSGTDFSYSSPGTYLDKTYLPGEFGIAGGSTPPTTDYADRTYARYDEPDTKYPITGKTQNNLRGRVSYTWNQNDTTWYSYNFDGLTDTIVQRLIGFDADGDGILNELSDLAVVKYTYDFTGNVTEVACQPGKTDQFIHTYTYDLDNRLSAVSTKAGTSGTTEQQAMYGYYAHGPLKRTELGGNVQGIDYVYTLQGWLKSINNPSLNADDPGKDSYTGINSGFYPDVFAMSLDYYEGDYVRANSNIESKPASNRYDGNIAMERWQNKYFPAATGTHTAYKYTYDERNFLYNAIYGSYNYTSDALTESNAYRVAGPGGNNGMQYDANGNISYMSRKQNTGSLTDNLGYTYKPGMNQLDYVSDAAGTAGEDIGNQGAGNYTYNSIGQMTGNVADNQKLIYDAYGKVTEVHKTDNSLLAKYFYDDRGFRIKKEVYTTGDPQTTWYVRDVNGNLLTSYYKDGSNNTKLLETPVYGSSRIGLAQYNPDRTLGKYVYELTDHLGNVRAVVSEDGADAGTDIDILSAADYYPGGMRLPNRWYVSENYRFGYQGQFAEKDPETGYNQFEARLYDARLGRWMAPDPINRTNISPYIGMGNNPVIYNDIDGRDIVILIAHHAVGGLGHMAMIVGRDAQFDINGNQLPNTGWYFYSKNGPINNGIWSNLGFKGESYKPANGKFYNTIEEFRNDGTWIGNGGKSYDEGLRIYTDPNQDIRMMTIASRKVKEDYKLRINNCTHVVREAMIAAQIKNYSAIAWDAPNIQFERLAFQLNNGLEGIRLDFSKPVFPDIKLDFIKNINFSNLFNSSSYPCVTKPCR